MRDAGIAYVRACTCMCVRACAHVYMISVVVKVNMVYLLAESSHRWCRLDLYICTYIYMYITYVHRWRRVCIYTAFSSLVIFIYD